MDRPTIGVYKGLQVQALSTRAGIENINNAIAYMQTIDDAGAAIESILMRMKEIAVQAQTSTTDADQRTALSLEYLHLVNSGTVLSLILSGMAPRS